MQLYCIKIILSLLLLEAQGNEMESMPVTSDAVQFRC